MRCFGISIFLLFFCIGYVFAQGNLKKNEKQPVKVVSKKVIYKHNNKIVNFIGDVYLIRGDLKLWCDSLKVFIKEKTSSGKEGKGKELTGRENIEKIIAEGNVRINMEDKHGTCNRAVYLSKEDVFLLEGNAVLTQGKNVVKGDVVKIYMEENRTEVIGKEKRVEVIFYPKEKK